MQMLVFQEQKTQPRSWMVFYTENCFETVARIKELGQWSYSAQLIVQGKEIYGSYYERTKWLGNHPTKRKAERAIREALVAQYASA